MPTFLRGDPSLSRRATFQVSRRVEKVDLWGLKHGPRTNFTKTKQTSGATVRISNVYKSFETNIRHRGLHPNRGRIIFGLQVSGQFSISFHSPPNTTMFYVPPRLLDILTFRVSRRPRAGNSCGASGPVRQNGAKYGIDGNQTGHLTRPSRLVYGVIAHHRPMNHSRLRRHPRSRRVKGIQGRVFSGLVYPRKPPPLRILSISTFL